MKRKNNYLLLTAVGVTFFLNSCRSTDTDKMLESGLVAVKVNLLGTEFEEEESSSPQAQASINEKRSLSTSVNHKQVELINPGLVVVSELSTLPKELKSTAQASKGLDLQAAISGSPVTSGKKFRIIAYKASDGSYQTHQDYTVGQSGTPLTLDGGVSYDMVVYSYNSSSLPVISSGEMSNISSAVVNYDNSNRDFLYKKISGFTPTGGISNSLNIVLKHLFTEVTTKFVSNAGNITGVSNALISPHYINATIPLLSGLLNRSGSGNTAITFPSATASLTRTSDAIMVNGNGLTTFSATVSLIGGGNKELNYTNSFAVTPSTQKLLTVDIKRCGAIVNGAFKEFMCHNLGATNTADPLTPSAAIHGGKYQWGSNGTSAGWYISQATDQSNSGAISGWNTLNPGVSNWSDTSKTANDPCPAGYRVPTRAQWQSVIDSNPLTRLGTWTNSSTNYTSGAKFGNYLFLPAAGERNPSTGGGLDARGSNGYYWSSTVNTSITTSSYNLVFTSSSVSVFDNSYRQSGYSVRCIAQ